ncbi:hypothetical protein MPRM_39240 [Mycobacterium parmense]|uniref:Biofilm regulator BssS n=2 Tax=Mycobacterium parmense TaxID=185642 RepID=A0A7I7Z0I5_9MYCO|nr:hypothetical protein MPRM_39240 [Mycobacterium parmense]
MLVHNGAVAVICRSRHPSLQSPGMQGPPQDRDVAATPPEPGKGAAADAIAHAESALARQNSAVSQLDLQVVSAILNAHLQAVEGKEALAELQRETEAAVRTRSDLDTPAGARDFQRFLIGKLRDIRGVVLNVSLDDTSKSALMAAWTSLYECSRSEPHPGEDQAPAPPGDEPAASPDDLGTDPLLDSLLADDPGLPPGEAPATLPQAAYPPAPPIPNLGMGPMPGLGVPGGLPLPTGLADLADSAARHPETDASGPDDPDTGAHDHVRDSGATPAQGELASAGDPEAGPTPVTLPDGETVTAPSPRLAAAINAAVGGAPIAEAFRQQGITLPPPGTPVTDPIDPKQVNPGDVGILTDRYALALGPGKALLDGQIQHIGTVSGPNFLGWEHPPGANTTVTAPAEPNAPTPTRPANAPATSGQ